MTTDKIIYGNHFDWMKHAIMIWRWDSMKHRVILTLLAVALSLAMIGCNTHVIAARAEGFNELKPPEEVKAE